MTEITCNQTPYQKEDSPYSKKEDVLGAKKDRYGAKKDIFGPSKALCGGKIGPYGAVLAPFAKKDVVLGSAIKPYSERDVYGQQKTISGIKYFCPVLLQENSRTLLQENGGMILL
ncbi:TPA: hypothetical protein DEB29_03445 [Candidatus Wolfebacteria bacterium]|nr:hypothetical protein [Candidatus Wolfebacteria bacterium]